MSHAIRSILYKKILGSLQNVENTTKMAIQQRMAVKHSTNNNVYYCEVPLKSKTRDIQELANNIRVDDTDTGLLNNIYVKDDTLTFDLFRDGYVKLVLESNYDNREFTESVQDTRNIIVEYSSPNIAKPFHIGHLRSTIIGNCIANIHKFIRNNVTRINYIGDWGTQYGFIQLGLNIANVSDEELRNNPIQTLYKAYVAANRQAETDPSISAEASEVFGRLERGDPVLRQQWENFKSYTVEEMKKTYSRLGIEFDDYHWESMYGGEKSQHVIHALEEANLLKSDEVARKVVSVDSHENVPIIKSDGATLYITRDIAAAIDRYEKYRFDRMFYVVDESQHMHFKKLVSLLKAMKWPWARNIEHLRFGRVTGMSTRKGNVVFLEDFINTCKDVMREKQRQSENTKVSLDLNDDTADILAVSAIIINDLRQRRLQSYKFDWTVMSDVAGDTGSKLQYCHCRLSNLEKNSGASLVRECDPTLLREPEVDDLVLTMSNFEEAVFHAAKVSEPCILTLYLFRLNKSINRAINKLKVKDAPADLGNQRLLLFHAARNVLGRGMRLLGLRPLDRM